MSNRLLPYIGMWLELPVRVDASGSDVGCLEPLYYHVLVLLFSLLTLSVDNEAGEGPEGIDSGMQWAKILLQTILTVRLVTFVSIIEASTLKLCTFSICLLLLVPFFGFWL